MIFMIFFLLLFSAQVYFCALIKSHLFDMNIVILSTQHMQTTLYAEGLCIYIGSIITSTESMKVSNLPFTIYFSEIYFDYHDSIRATVLVTQETPEQYVLTIECVRANGFSQQYHAKIQVEPASFSILYWNQSKKELFR